MESIKYAKSDFNKLPSTILTAADFKKKYTAKKSLGKGVQSTVYLCQNNENFKLSALKKFKKDHREFAIREYNISRYLLDKIKESNVENSDNIIEDNDIERVSCSSSTNNHISLDDQSCISNLSENSSRQEKTDSIEMDTEVNDEGSFSTLLDEDMNLYEIDGELCFFQEVGQEDLYDFLNKRCMTRLQKYSVMKQITKAVKFLHKHNMLHRDIKLENILVTPEDNEKLNAKLIDYGLAASLEFDEEIELIRDCGSPAYKAPEVIPIEYDVYSLHIHTKAIDIFSLGVLFYALLYKKYPFKTTTYTGYTGYTRYEVSMYTYDILNKDDIKYAHSMGHSEELIFLIKDMLKLKSELRPSIGEIEKRLENAIEFSI